MVKNGSIWLERLLSLRSSLHRKAAVSVGLQYIHAEILEYLAKCNRYSNTARALTEYLGLTKGSVSQSLKLLEGKGFVNRIPCSEDKRVARLYLTPVGRGVLGEISQHMPELKIDEASESDALVAILRRMQSQNGLRGFGLCRSCHYNETLSQNNFKCGLTGEALTALEVEQVCREFRF